MPEQKHITLGGSLRSISDTIKANIIIALAAGTPIKKIKNEFKVGAQTIKNIWLQSGRRWEDVPKNKPGPKAESDESHEYPDTPEQFWIRQHEINKDLSDDEIKNKLSEAAYREEAFKDQQYYWGKLDAVIHHIQNLKMNGKVGILNELHEVELWISKL